MVAFAKPCRRNLGLGDWGTFSTVEARAVAHLVECLCNMHKALHSVLSSCSLGVDAEAGGSEAQGHVLLFREFEASKGSRRPCLKGKKTLEGIRHQSNDNQILGNTIDSSGCYYAPPTSSDTAEPSHPLHPAPPSCVFLQPPSMTTCPPPLHSNRPGCILDERSGNSVMTDLQVAHKDKVSGPSHPGGLTPPRGPLGAAPAGS